MSSGAVLVGDIGGTNVRLAEAHLNGSGHARLGEVAVLRGDDYAHFDDALSHYLKRQNGQAFDGALFAFAGPVRANALKMTNRDWVIDGDSLANRFSLKSVRLVNDYAAMARGIPELSPDMFQCLHAGRPPAERAPILVAGPGTGLGVATLIPKGGRGWHVLTGEGGHAAYAPRTPYEWAVLERLQARYGYVSKELVLSGSGMDAVHQAICEIEGANWVKTAPGDLIDAAEQGPGIARTLCELRARATMDALGDAALTNGTLSGVVITGGVAVRLAKWLSAPESLARFFLRGPKSDYMDALPIHLLLSGEAALIGAAALYFDQETGE